MNIGKKLLASLLAICMVISTLPMSVFAAELKPFTVGGNTYSDLSAALSAAEADATNKTVIVTKSATVSGEITIPSGVTLLVPHNDSSTEPVTKPTAVQSWIQPTEFRKLTVTGKITVAAGGAISVASGISSDQGYSGAPSGPYGHILLSDADSKIELQSGATLYAFGFITGDGTVEAQSGSTVYELFQFNDFRGGSASSTMTKSQNLLKKTFPFSQYYIQNIQAKLRIRKGAREELWTAAYALFSSFVAQASFIADNGMFYLTADDSYLEKYYDEQKDRLYIDVHGDAELKAISVTISFYSFNSEQFVLPINGNISIGIKSGTLSVTSDAKLLPGAEITVDKNAELKINDGIALFAYGSDEWKADNFTWKGTYLNPAKYAVGRVKARDASSLVDVIMDVNGTVTVGGGSNGGLFTTGDGAAIKSTEGNGVITFTNPSDGKRKLYEVTQSSSSVSYHEISTTSAQLLNGDGSNTKTADCGDNAKFTYVDDQWIKQGTLMDFTVQKVTATYDAQGHCITSALTVDHGAQPTVQYQKHGTGIWTADKPVDVGVYDVKITRDEDAYYKAFEQTVTDAVTITSAPLTLDWGTTTFTYTGALQSVTPTLGGLQNNEELNVTLSENKYTDVGNYTATATISDGETGKISNYTLPGNLTQEWSITQAEAPDITFPTVSGTVTYAPNQTLEDIQLTGGSTQYGDFTWTNPGITPTVAQKEYSVTFTPSEATTKNYEEITQTTANVTIDVQKGEQDAPVNLIAHHPETIGGTGSISGVDATMEYRRQDSGSDEWTSVDGTEITGLQPGIYLVRYRENDNQKAGTSAEVEVDNFNPSRETMPSACIDFKTEKLTGLVADGAYTIGGQEYSAGETGEIAIETGWFGTTLSIIKKGDGVKTVNSNPQSLTIPARPAAPANLEGGYTSAPGASDGTVKGLSEGVAYEYELDGVWTTLTDETEFAKGTYQVRLAATDNAFHSDAAAIEVKDPDVEETPDITIDYANEKLAGFGDGSYTVNGEAVTVTEGKTAIEESWFGTTVSVVKKGTAPASVDSAAVTVSVPERPAAPEGLYGVTPSSPEADNGSISGLDAETAYEYKPADGEWTAVEPGSTFISGLTVGVYQVRTAATAAKFASKPAEVEVVYVPPAAPGDVTTGHTSPDGSSTWTTTKPDGTQVVTDTATDGTVTETTTKPDGTVTEKVTTPDNTVTEKTTDKDGVITETTTKPDNTVTEKVTQTDGSATERTTTPDGVVGQKSTDAEGKVTSAEVVIPKEAEKQDVVTAPVEVPAAKTAEEAPEISVRTGSEESTKVEIPVTEVGPGTVAVVVNEDGTEEIVRECVVSENGVVLNVEGDVTLKIVDNTETFEDVEPVNHWATDAVEFVAARELFKGTAENKFTPNGSMTRGMMVTVLYRLAYEPDAVEEGFADVKSDAYYSDAVAWAAENGVVNGYADNTFAPDDNVSREQLVTILHRYAQKKGYATKASGTLANFADAKSVSSWASDAMSWAVELGLVNGTDASHISPAKSATRAEVATILMRFCEKVVK